MEQNRTPIDKSNLLTIEQAAELLNLKISRIRYEVLKKRIPFVKIGKSIRFERTELARWVEKLRNTPARTPRQLAKEYSAIRRWARQTYGRR